MTYGRGGFADRRSGYGHKASTPVGVVAQRRAWLAVLDQARQCAADPAAAPRELAHAMRGLTPTTFPLANGDLRRRAVTAFHELASYWVQASEHARSPFAAALAALITPLDAILHELGAAMAQQGLARRGMGEDD